MGAGRSIFLTPTSELTLAFKLETARKGRDGKTRNKISLLVLASCLKPAIIMSWVLLTDHGELLNDRAPCQRRLFHGKKDGVSSHSLILQGEDGSHRLGFLFRREGWQTRVLTALIILPFRR